jgi:WD40 repeat protein
MDGAVLATPAFSSDGNILTMSPWNDEIYVRDLRKPAADIIARFTIPGRHVTALAFSPDAQTLAAGADDGTLQLLDLREPTAPPIALAGHRGLIATLAFSPRGDTLASGSADRTVRLWSLRAAINPATIFSGMRLTGNVALTPDGARLAHAEANSSDVQVWNVLEPSARSIQIPNTPRESRRSRSAQMAKRWPPVRGIGRCGCGT